jgi:peroxiredoxin
VSTKTRKNKQGNGLSLGVKIAGIVGLAVIALAAVYFSNTSTVTAGSALAGRYPFEVGNPGPGELAPQIALPSTQGGTFDLRALEGETVLLYFQEGAMCPPCWDQLKEIEQQWAEFEALGIDRIVSITTDSLSVLRRVVANARLSSEVLSDPNLDVSYTYTTNNYGMMGGSHNGHSFILVGPDGKIQWRADYGGAPKYTMYMPVPNLLADLRQGLQESSN